MGLLDEWVPKILTDSDGSDPSDDSGTPPAPVMPLMMVSAPMPQQVLPPPTPVVVGQDGFNQAYQNVLAQNPVGANWAAFGSGLSNQLNSLGFGDGDTTEMTNKVLRKTYPASALTGDIAQYYAVGRVPRLLSEYGKVLIPAFATTMLSSDTKKR
jgi:hypothetical protein